MKKIVLPENWQHFSSSVVAVILLPLIPIFLELFFQEWKVSQQTLFLTCSMYCITLGVSSENLSFLLISLLCSLIFSAALVLQLPELFVHRVYIGL